jgi:hypothetical protein
MERYSDPHESALMQGSLRGSDSCNSWRRGYANVGFPDGLARQDTPDPGSVPTRKTRNPKNFYQATIFNLKIYQSDRSVAPLATHPPLDQSLAHA